MAQRDIVAVAEMAALLGRLVREHVGEAPEVPEEEERRLALEVEIAMRDNAFERGIMELGDLTPFTCPDCHGALVRLKEGERFRYRCHTGHAFTPSTLLAGVTESVEDLLWQAMRGLEESTMLLNHMGEHFEAEGDAAAAALFREKAEQTGERARTVHDSVFRHERLSEDLRHSGRVGPER